MSASDDEGATLDSQEQEVDTGSEEYFGSFSEPISEEEANLGTDDEDDDDVVYPSDDDYDVEEPPIEEPPKKAVKRTAPPPVAEAKAPVPEAKAPVAVRQTYISPVQTRYPGKTSAYDKVYTKCLSIVTREYPLSEQPESLAMCAVNNIRYGSVWEKSIQEMVDVVVEEYYND